jgi:hypothetical protein
MQALAMHPALAPAEDPESGPAGMQGPTPIQLPGDQWSQFQTCPSYGGKSDVRMSDSARYNEEAGIMEVIFENSGHKYQYTGISPKMFYDFMAGRWAENNTATHAFLMSRGGVRVS